MTIVHFIQLVSLPSEGPGPRVSLDSSRDEEGEMTRNRHLSLSENTASCSSPHCTLCPLMCIARQPTEKMGRERSRTLLPSVMDSPLSSEEGREWLRS